MGFVIIGGNGNMEVLCVCNTNYQLIVATQMALTIKKNDNVSILLSVFIKGSEEIYKRIQQEGLFKNVFLLKIDDIYNTENVAEKYKRVKTHLQELKYSIFGSDLGIFEKHIKF